MKIRSLHPEALAEFRKAVRDYEEKQHGLGERFKNNVIAAAEWVQEGASSGAPWLHGTRLARVHRFPYGLVFREHDDRISIVAVYHFSRREDYWVHRLADLTE